MLTLRPDEISHEALQTWIDLQVREDEDFARAFVRFVTGRSHCAEVCDLSGGNRADLEKTIADLEAEADDLHREVDKATDEAADLETDLRKAERDRDAAEDEADSLRKERDALLAGDPDGALALEALEEARCARDWVRGLAPSWAERLRAIAADLDRKGFRKDRAISRLSMLAADMSREAEKGDE